MFTTYVRKVTAEVSPLKEAGKSIPRFTFELIAVIGALCKSAVKPSKLERKTTVTAPADELTRCKNFSESRFMTVHAFGVMVNSKYLVGSSAAPNVQPFELYTAAAAVQVAPVSE